MSIKNYLIIPQYWLGDIIMTQALAKKIKSDKKKSKIDLLVPGIYAPLTNRMPEINECMVFNCNHNSLCVSERIRMSKMLKGKYDECIILSRSLKSSIIPLLSSIPIRTGEIGEYRYFIINNIKKFSKDVKTNRFPNTLIDNSTFVSRRLAETRSVHTNSSRRTVWCVCQLLVIS